MSGPIPKFNSYIPSQRISLLSLLLGPCHGKAGSTHAHVSWGNFGNFGRLQSRPSVQRPTVHRSPSVSQTYSVSTPTTPNPPQSYTSPVPPALKSTYTPPHAVTPTSSDGDATNLHSNHHAHVSFGGKTSHSFGNTVKKRPSAHQTPSVSVTTYSAPPIPTTPTPPQSYTSSVPPTVFQSTYASPLPVIDTPGSNIIYYI